MKKKDWFVSIVAGVILGILAMNLGITKGIVNIPAVRAEDKMGEILNLMLKSHTTWQTIGGEATTQWFSMKDGSQHGFYSSVVVANPNQAHFTIASDDGSSNTEWIGDGATIFEIDRLGKTYQEYKQEDVTSGFDRLPADVASIDKNIIFRHPMAMIIPSPVADYIFPTGLAQRQGEYSFVGEAVIANRNAWVVDYLKLNDNNDATMKARYWVDSKTGVILQAYTYSTEPDSFGTLIESTSFSSISFDLPVQNDEFTPSLDGLK